MAETNKLPSPTGAGFARAKYLRITISISCATRPPSSAWAIRAARAVPPIVTAARGALRVCEVPVAMRARAAGRSSITTFRSFYYVAKVLLALFVGLFPREHLAIED